MGARRWVWIAVAVAGVVLVAGGVVWLFVALGAEKADRLSSGIGAGAAVVGLLVAALGAVRVRAQAPAGAVDATSGPEVSTVGGQVVENSTFMGANIQVGGSVAGGITAHGVGPTGDGEPDQ